MFPYLVNTSHYLSIIRSLLPVSDHHQNYYLIISSGAWEVFPDGCREPTRRRAHLRGIGSISTFATSFSASSASSSTKWRNRQSPTFPSSSSLTSSVHSGRGSQPQSNTNNNNCLPRRLPSNIKRTCVSGVSALIPRMPLSTGGSAVMSGVSQGLGCAPCELRQKEIDIIGGPPQQQQLRERERKRAGHGRGSNLRRAEASSRVRSNRSTSILLIRSDRIRRRARRLSRFRRARRDSDSWGKEMGAGHAEYTWGRSTRLQDALLSGGETPSCCLLLTSLTLCLVVHCIFMMETLL